MRRTGSRSTRRARALPAAFGLAAVLLLSACSMGGAPAMPTVPTTSPAPTTSPGATGDAPGTASQALALVPTIWRVRDAAGESADTWIRFDSEIDLIRPKGDAFLSWSTQGAAILTHVEGWSMSLGRTPPTVPWLTAATAFARDGSGWVLTDATGRRTARLVRDGTPPPSTQTVRDVPKVDETIRREHTDAVPGVAVGAIEPQALVGTWGLPGIAAADGSVTVARDGAWEAKSSCEVLGSADGGAGASRLLPSGFLLVTEGGIAGVGCTTPEKAPPADARAILGFGTAASVAISGAELTVYDRHGRTLGRLQRKG